MLDDDVDANVNDVNDVVIDNDVNDIVVDVVDMDG